MKIQVMDATSVDVIIQAIRCRTLDRFSFQWDLISKNGRKYNAVIKLREIRLLEKKYYCGNHPEACPVLPFKTRGHSERDYLEGTDWVDWNDRVNDALDALDCKANVATSVCIIRKGTERRVCYSSKPQGIYFHNWEYDEWNAYDDYCGKVAPPSEYPYGTPGSYERKVMQ